MAHSSEHDDEAASEGGPGEHGDTGPVDPTGPITAPVPLGGNTDSGATSAVDDDTDVLEPLGETTSEGTGFDGLTLEAGVEDMTDPMRQIADLERAAVEQAAMRGDGGQAAGEAPIAPDGRTTAEGPTSREPLAGVYAERLLRRTSEHDGSFSQGPELVDPFEMTGFGIVEARHDSSDSLGSDATQSGLAEAPRPRDSVTGISRRRRYEHGVRVGLDGTAQSLHLDAPWAQFLIELRLEIDAETHRRLRTSYLVLMSALLRLYGGIGAVAADRLLEAGSQVALPVRTLLVELLAKHWSHPGERFVELLERLEKLDERTGQQASGARRASIAVERLIDRAVDAATAERLEHLGTPPETLCGLTYRALDGHRRHNRSQAARAWEQIAEQCTGEARHTLGDLAAFLLRDTPSFFDHFERRLEAEALTRELLVMTRREAAAMGDHLREAVALRQLLAADVAFGRQLDAAGGPDGEQLKELVAGRFFRLSTLLDRLDDAVKAHTSVEGLEPHKMVRDAVALMPGRPLYLRRLARWSGGPDQWRARARSLGALGALATRVGDDELSAVYYAALARAVYVNGGSSESVDRYLACAVQCDPGCAPALLTSAQRLLADGQREAYEELLVHTPERARRLITFDETELQLLAEADYEQLADLTERRLESAVEQEDWARLTLRLAHLLGWYLAPDDDSRRRAQALEQVLIAAPHHLATLVELLDVRLARGNYLGAVELLEDLVESCEHPAVRASWLTELAGLVEHYLGTPQAAFEHYEAACALESSHSDAFWGMLRTDMTANESCVDPIVERLERRPGGRENEDLFVELIMRVDRSERAAQVLDARFADRSFWLLLRACRRLEEGVEDSEAVATLWQMWSGQKTGIVLGLFERLVDRDASRTSGVIRRHLERIGESPLAEGPVVRATASLRETDDVAVVGDVAARRAARSKDPLTRATETVTVAIIEAWRGDFAAALSTCAELLERYPEFVPAIKLAKLACRRLARWAELVQWCEREAEATASSQLAFEDRAAAADVQKDKLGDFEAACDQFQTLLDDDPTHREAFDNLKPLLLQRGDVDRLLELYATRLEHASDVDEQCRLLNEMADICLHRARNLEAAVGYFRRSLELDPDQLRSQRILAELHVERGETDEAIACYRRAVELTDDSRLLERLFEQIGRLYEEIGRSDEALDAFEQALRHNPGRAELILDIVRLEEEAGDLETAMIHLRRLESTTSRPDMLRRGRVYKARFALQLDRPASQVLDAHLDLLAHHPEEIEAGEAVCEYLAEQGESERIPIFFSRVARTAVAKARGRVFEPHYALARHLGHADRAFCLAAVARAHGRATDEMTDYHAVGAGARRWPRRPLEASVVERIVPHDAWHPFVELLRATDQQVRSASDTSALERLVDEQGIPLADDSGTALELAAGWPTLFGQSVDEIYEVDAVAGGSALWVDHNTRLIVDRRWRESSEPTSLLVELGRQLGAEALGVGSWLALERRQRATAFMDLVGVLAPGWGGRHDGDVTEGFDQKAFRRHVEARDDERLAAWAGAIAGRSSRRAIEPQLRLVELAAERLGCIVLDDPYRFLPHTRLLNAQDNLGRQPWSFLIGPLATEVRRRVGIAYAGPDV